MMLRKTEWPSRVLMVCVLILGLLGSSAFAADPIITELMASNSSVLADEDGDYPDWLEIHNPDGASIDLSGWFLTDDPESLQKWSFPSAVVPSGEYLIVFASDKDRSVAGSELHLNFKLSADGEYLALVKPDGTTIADEYAPAFPEQRSDISFGLQGATYGYFAEPTPGEPNTTTQYSGFVAQPSFSTERGFYETPIQVTLATSTPAAEIRYTLNGSEPTESSGAVYTTPISISQTAVLRATAFCAGYLPSNTMTHTYIFVGDVVTQSSDGSKPNAEWPDPYGPYCGFHDPQDIDYGMDPEIVGAPAYSALMEDALLSVPTMSIVTDLDNLFSPSTGIYVNAKQHGPAWERPVSLELLQPNGDDGFHINCGARIRGGWSRWGSCPKHAFRFFFRSDYGDDKLRFALFDDDGVSDFEKVDLRCPQNYSWSFKGDPKNTFLRDIFCRSVQGAMGQPYTKSRFYHLYINGQYWGLYQTQERSESRYAASYFGGDSDDYDVMKVGSTLDVDGEVVYTDGNRDAWDRLISAAIQGFASDEDYYRVQGMNPDGTRNMSYERLVDVDNLIDYMICIYYSSNKDAPISDFLGRSCNNFYAVYNRNNPDGFKFFAHDNEHVLDIYSVSSDRTADISVKNGDWYNYFNPQTLHQEIDVHPEYRLQFADHVHRHFFNGGVLTPDALLDRFQAYANEIEPAMIAESARWGDAKESCAGGPYTKNDHWLPRVNSIINNYLPQRSAIVLNQFRTRGWYPAVDAPVFSQHGETAPSGYSLTMSAPAGTIYYTLDGSDPRLIGGSVNPASVAYTAALTLTTDVTIKSRVLDGGTWSALNEASFILGAPPIILNELMYNPPGDEEGSEFVELFNPSSTLAADLSGWRLEGVGLTFPPGTLLGPESFGLVVRDQTVFESVHGTGLPLLAEYGGALDNGGEQIKLRSSQGEIVASVRYDDDAPWPITPDGDGPSLELIDLDQDNGWPSNWSASALSGGTPGAANSTAGTTLPVPSIWVNEVLPDNHTVIQDEQGDFDPWIELHNGSDTAVDVGGLSLTNDYATPAQWVIPAGTVMEGHSWLLIWADGETVEGPYHATVSLSPAGGSVGLYTADGRIIDYLNYDALAADVSYGKYPDGTWVRREFTTPTPGDANESDTAPLILNEYNAVKSSEYLKDDGVDTFFGRVLGNGGNWFELVVTEDHVDLRGWMLTWTEEPSDTGTLTLTTDPAWSDLRAGTIITIGEDSTSAGGLNTDVSYDPSGGDWWIHINTLKDGTPQETYVTTTTSVSGDGPGNFSVGNDNWQLTIRNASGTIMYGPCGEGIEPPSGVGSDEVFRLEENPGPYIHPHSDYDDGASSTFGSENTWSSGTAVQDFGELRSVLEGCQNDAECNDGTFCNGVETCEGGFCQSGENPCPGQMCREADDTCVECLDDEDCSDGAFCDGEESCVDFVCENGDEPCQDGCEQCDETHDECDWCRYDLDLDGFIGPGDFAFFAGCYGQSYDCDAPEYRTGDLQCCISNFDQSSDSFVGPGDFAGFAGCFGDYCEECATCWGMPGRSTAKASPRVTSALIPLRRVTAYEADTVLPKAATTFCVGDTLIVELWATVTAGEQGLAAAHLDVAYDATRLALQRTVISESFSLFSNEGLEHGETLAETGVGLIHAMGGCAPLGEKTLGLAPTWVRVGTLEFRVEAPGISHIRTKEASRGYGIAIVDHPGLMDTSASKMSTCRVELVSPTSLEHTPEPGLEPAPGETPPPSISAQR